MFFLRGRVPDRVLFQPLRQRVSILLLVSLGVVAALPAIAATSIPLGLAEAERLALQNEPGVAALRAGASALAESSVAAGELPDPKLRIGLANYPLSNGNFSSEAMTQAQLGIRQEFPRGRLRATTRDRLLALAAAEEQSADARSRAVLQATRFAWLDALYWQRAGLILAESRPLFEDLLRVTESLYAVGRSAQSDVLRAELELQRLEDRLLEARRSQSNAQGVLSEWLGPEAWRPLDEQLPEWEPLPRLAELQGRIAEHPLLHAAEAKIDAGRASVAMAEEKTKAGWALDLGYGYREGFNPDGQPRSDFISLAVIVDLPFNRKNRQDRDLAAALHSRSAAVAGMARLDAELQSQLQVSFATWTEQTRRLALYETTITALTAQQAEAALLAYQSDTGSFADVMLGQIDVVNTELERLAIEIERAKARAIIANLGGLNR